MAARPVVSVYAVAEPNKVSTTVPLPTVFTAPIRTDIVQFVHTNMAKNNRQPYAVFRRAGHQHSAISWGTGRAVSCVPRVAGGGTGRSGQGAFANMCRKGRMFAPTKIWRKWHRRINVNQKRYATMAALAASAVPSLVFARGHRIDNVNEIPFVVADEIAQFKKTKEAVAFLKAAGCYEDVTKVIDSKHLRCGQGKMRNRRYVMKLGPMIIHDVDEDLIAFRNIPGVELASVRNLNVLRLAPGGHVGRFIIWTRKAFEKLDSIYHIPRNIMTVPDVSRLINSNEIQSVCRPQKKIVNYPKKVNPLKNKAVMDELNPYAAIAREAEKKAVAQNIKNKKANLAKKREEKAKHTAQKAAYFESMMQ